MSETDYLYAEDIDGIWHIRRDDFWDKDISADVRAHTQCGADIWSCHVATEDPRVFYSDPALCPACFTY